jgi:hypothetical protein
MPLADGRLVGCHIDLAGQGQPLFFERQQFVVHPFEVLPEFGNFWQRRVCRPAVFKTAVRRPIRAMPMLAPSASCETESMEVRLCAPVVG